MKLTKKQQRELKIIEWFIPINCDWNHPHAAIYDNTIHIKDIKENNNGAEPEEAFLMRSQFGKFPAKVKNKARLRAILWGKIWRERMLSEVWDLEYTFKEDFEGEPDYIKEFVFSRLFKT